MSWKRRTGHPFAADAKTARCRGQALTAVAREASQGPRAGVCQTHAAQHTQGTGGKIAAPKIAIIDYFLCVPNSPVAGVKLDPRTRYSLSILSAHTTSATRSGGVTKRAFFPSMSDWATARASEQAVHMWRGILCCIVLGIVSDSGGQPTGTTEFITASFIKDTASPSKKIWTSWPASANAFA